MHRLESFSGRRRIWSHRKSYDREEDNLQSFVGKEGDREEDVREFMWNRVKNNSILLDSSGDFRIIPFLSLKKSAFFSDDDVSLVTQGNFFHLHHLDLLIRRWRGPISIAVYSEVDELPLAINFIHKLCECFPLISDLVTFHLVYPDEKFDPDVEETHQHFSGCHNIKNELERLEKSHKNYDDSRRKFPNNLLRNVARRYSETEFILVLDIDMIPNLKLLSQWRKFSSSPEYRSLVRSTLLFVVPTYEVKEDLHEDNLPGDKRQLMQLIHHQDARPFYIEVCWKCQKSTNYSLWEKIPLDNLDDLSPVYSVPWKDPWEPFYISSKAVPDYDERFRAYGFNRISQVCESFVAGFFFRDS